MKTFVRAMCTLLVVVLSFGCVSLTAFAQEDREVLDENLVKLPAEIMKASRWIISPILSCVKMTTAFIR